MSYIPFYVPSVGPISERRLTLHGAIVHSLAELSKLAGEAHALGVEDDISGPSSGLAIFDAYDQVISEVNAVAPAGWLFIDDDGQPSWVLS